MTKYTIQQIKDSLPAQKNEGDSLWVRYVVRNISFPLTYCFVNLGFSAWCVSVLSIVIALIACCLFYINSEITRWLGVAFIHLWMICDCVDGNIARVKKTTGPMGEFIDAQSGYIISGFCFFSIGISAYYTTNSEHAAFFLAIGGLTSIAYILPRLIHQKFTVATIKIHGKDVIAIKEQQKLSFQSIRRRIGKEIGISGIFMILIVIAQVFKIYDYIISFYFVFSMISLMLTILGYSIKAKQK